MNTDLQVNTVTDRTGDWLRRRSTFVWLVRAAVYMDAAMQPMAMVYNMVVVPQW